ncbi:MAG: HDOD domain-containing protein, partial [Proteobacteria bacterium]|nr:HDOD domain-containing protein [Pseudomonadota bacterium]
PAPAPASASTPGPTSAAEAPAEPTIEGILSASIEAIEAPAATELSSDAWAPLVEEILARPDWVPNVPTTFPLVATRMLEILRDPEFDLNLLVGVVQRDAGIAASLLRVANSTAFAPNAQVTSLRSAITTLGARHVFEIAICSASRSLYDVPSFKEVAMFPRLWPTMFSDAIANAFTSGRLALDLSNTSSERALIVGLLADVGRPAALRIVARLVGEGYIERPSDEVVVAALDEVCPVIGKVVVAAMGLPPELLDACTISTSKEAMVARLVASIGAIQRRSARSSHCASEIRDSAVALRMSPLVVRMQFAQRTAYFEQASQMFG